MKSLCAFAVVFFGLSSVSFASAANIAASSISGADVQIDGQVQTRDDNQHSFRVSLPHTGSFLSFHPAVKPGLSDDLGSKIFVRFERNNAGRLRVFMSQGNDPYEITSDFEKEIFATGILDIELEFHHHGHLVIGVNGVSEEFATEACFSCAGRFGRLNLHNGTLLEMSVGAPKNVH